MQSGPNLAIVRGVNVKLIEYIFIIIVTIITIAIPVIAACPTASEKKAIFFYKKSCLGSSVGRATD